MILYLKDPKNSTQNFLHHKQLQQLGKIKMNLQKSLAFLFTNNEQIEKEYMGTIPFTIASKKSYTKDVNDLYKENYKPLKKKIKDDYRRWKDLPCSCMLFCAQHSKTGYTTKSNLHV
jgi:hypothetical protein